MSFTKAKHNDLINNSEDNHENNKKTNNNMDNKSHKVYSFNFKRLSFFIISLIVIIMIGSYFIGLYYYNNHFLNNTLINSVECSNLDNEEVVSLMENKSLEYTLVINGFIDLNENIGELGTIKAEDIEYNYKNIEAEISNIMDSQNNWIWPLNFIFNSCTYDLEPEVCFDENLVKEKIEQLDAFKIEKMVAPKNAYISDYVEAEEGFLIVKETAGTRINRYTALNCIIDGINNNLDTIDLVENGCYMEAKIKQDSKIIVDNLELANKYISTSVTYDWNGNTVVVDKELLKDWITIENDKPVINEESIENFVSEAAKEYDTYGKKRNFTTNGGVEISLKSGAYGWKTDKKAEIEKLKKYICDGEQISTEPEYICRGYVKGMDDIGDSYVEINLSKQHLYLYENGAIVLESDFVSGNVSNGCTTPPGVFGITYKTKNAVLRGDNYATPVNYWMPFNGNIGMHDATWRGSFGGEIYLTNGSHGCVNMPLTKAKEIYEYMETGFPVVCYY